MEKFVTSLTIISALAAAFVWGWFAGGRHSEVAISKMETTTTDTVWTEVHDTAFVETAVNLLRTDTVKLAYVPEIVKSGTFEPPYAPENGISGTYRDTLFIHDSVFVEVPIERKVFTGENYRITAHGYRIGLDDVWISHPVVTATTTASYTRTKRWGFSVGAQIGYGYTVHGASPYAGIGVAFGYTF